MSPSLARFAPEIGERVAGARRPHPRAPEAPLVAPRTLDELAVVLRAAHRDRLSVVPSGAGSKLAWTRPPERADLVLTTRELAGIVSHVPDDGTISARAGTTIAELRACARAGGHWCTPDAPSPERATLGGTLAAGVSGADRTRFGPARHHVLGMQVVLADGTVAKCGGQLVKNVTGYDLHRLYTGSHGTLAVIASAALRLFPAPESEAWLERACAGLGDALELARRAAASGARWLSLSLVRAGGRWSVLARLGGLAEVVEHELALVHDMFGAPRARDARAAELAGDARDASPSAGPSFARLGCRPSRLADVARLLERHTGDARVEPALASIEVALTGDARELAAHRPELAAAGASLHLVAPELDVEPFDAPGPGLALMRRLQSQLDPQGVFARGRFAGGP